MNEVDIKGLDKGKVLQALFNASQQLGMGFLNKAGAVDMTYQDAAEIVKQQLSFDYLRGRVMKIDLAGDTFDPYLYDRDNGQGKAYTVIQKLRQEILATK